MGGGHSKSEATKYVNEHKTEDVTNTYKSGLNLDNHNGTHNVETGQVGHDVNLYLLQNLA